MFIYMDTDKRRQYDGNPGTLQQGSLRHMVIYMDTDKRQHYDGNQGTLQQGAGHIVILIRTNTGNIMAIQAPYNKVRSYVHIHGYGHTPAT